MKQPDQTRVAHDEGCLPDVEDAIYENTEVRCGAYCMGGSAVVDGLGFLADMAEAGWKIVRDDPSAGEERSDAA